MKKFNEYYKTYTAEYCKSTGLPMYSKGDKFENLYSRSKCEKLKRPVEDGEEPVAFYRVKNGYCGLYIRN